MSSTGTFYADSLGSYFCFVSNSSVASVDMGSQVAIKKIKCSATGRSIINHYHGFFFLAIWATDSNWIVVNFELKNSPNIDIPICICSNYLLFWKLPEGKKAQFFSLNIENGINNRCFCIDIRPLCSNSVWRTESEHVPIQRILQYLTCSVAN